jgi:hypothetical protein
MKKASSAQGKEGWFLTILVGIYGMIFLQLDCTIAAPMWRWGNRGRL